MKILSLIIILILLFTDLQTINLKIKKFFKKKD